MKKLLLTFLVAFISIGGLSGQNKSKGLVNGYFWETLGELGTQLGSEKSLKVFFLVGLREGYIRGFATGLEAMRDKHNITNSQFSDFSYGYFTDAEQIADGVDEFYKDFANKKIPVNMLVDIAWKKIQGKINNQEIEAELLRFRKEYN